MMERTFRTVLQGLRQECPTSMGLPVKVRRKRGYHCGLLMAYSTTSLDERSFLIVLFEKVKNRDGTIRPVSLEEMRDCLIHEWAHVMAWTPEHHNMEIHDAAWGVMFAKAYSAVVED